MIIDTSIFAPAKLNIHLHVLGRRADGYHDVRTLFQMVSIYDKLFFSLDTKGRGMVIENGATSLPEDDLMYRAWRAFCAAANLDFALHVRVNKGIPPQAGLGGGSSDCAAVLSFLNGAFDFILDEKSLLALAGELGSDVPFFLTETAAYAEGRGEVLVPIKAALRYWVLILNLARPMNTALAYRILDERNLCGGRGPEREKIIEAYGSLFPPMWPFFNTFGELYKADKDFCGEVEYLKAQGAEFCSITGSGSAFYGVFSEKNKAEMAFNAVSRRRKAWLAQPLERKPVAVLQ